MKLHRMRHGLHGGGKKLMQYSEGNYKRRTLSLWSVSLNLWLLILWLLGFISMSDLSPGGSIDHGLLRINSVSVLPPPKIHKKNNRSNMFFCCFCVLLCFFIWWQTRHASHLQQLMLSTCQHNRHACKPQPPTYWLVRKGLNPCMSFSVLNNFRRIKPMFTCVYLTQMYISCPQCFAFSFTTQLIELLSPDLVAGYINLNFCAIIQKVLQKKNVCKISRNISNPVQSSSAWTNRISSSHRYDVLSVLTIQTCTVWPAAYRWENYIRHWKILAEVVSV